MGEPKNKLEFVIAEDGSISFKVEKGNKMTLAPAVADEIWRMRELAHIERIILESPSVMGDDSLIADIEPLGEAFHEAKEELLGSLSEYLVMAALRRRDYEILQSELGFSEEDFDE